jgi:transposase
LEALDGGERIKALSNELGKRRASDDADVNKLLHHNSRDGVLKFSSLPLIKIGEVDRFPSGENLCSYAGLVPSVGSSESHSAYGSNNKAGDLSG